LVGAVYEDSSGPAECVRILRLPRERMRRQSGEDIYQVKLEVIDVTANCKTASQTVMVPAPSHGGLQSLRGSSGRPMEKKPELTIRYGANSFPVSGVCSACGEEMPAQNDSTGGPEENIAWLCAHFNSHLMRKHAQREDISPPG
jgi:hypothetical protein